MIDGLVRAGKHFQQQILTPEDISQAVLKQITTQSSGQVVVPSSHQAATMLRAFPQWLQEYFRNTGSLNLYRLRTLQKEHVGLSSL